MLLGLWLLTVGWMDLIMTFSVSSGQCPWNGVALVISNCRGVVEPDWSSEIFEHAHIAATDASLDLEPG